MSATSPRLMRRSAMAMAALVIVAGSACGGTLSSATRAHGPGTALPVATTVTATVPPTVATTVPPTVAATVPPTVATTVATTVPAPTSTARPPATEPKTTATPAPTVAPKPVAGGGVAIGDSVLEDVQIYAKDTLASHGISIDAAVSRQWKVGVSILSQLKASGKLPPVVIVGLGSNGVVTSSQFDQMMQAAAGAKRVVFMTVTGPLVGNNPVITAGVARYPTATLADWAALAAAHPDWFGPDHVHVGPAGATALGNLLASKV